MENGRITKLDIVEFIYIIFSIAGFVNVVLPHRTAVWNGIFSLACTIGIFGIVYWIELLKTKIVKEKEYTKYFIESSERNILNGYISVCLINILVTYIQLSTRYKVIAAIAVVFIYVVVYMRYYDIRTSFKYNWHTGVKTIKVTKIKDNCLNGRYCKIYTDKSMGYKYDIGGTYKIEYLASTFGLYVVKAEKE